MTKDEIKTLIAEKISGQGNQVDAGGALDAILNAIVDAIPEGGGGVSPVQLPVGTDLTDLTNEQYSQIYNNLLEGCCVIKLGPTPITVIAREDGTLSYFSTSQEPLVLTDIYSEEEEE